MLVLKTNGYIIYVLRKKKQPNLLILSISNIVCVNYTLLFIRSCVSAHETTVHIIYYFTCAA